MITFSETTGILDPIDIRKKAHMWSFDERTGICAHVWTGEDGKPTGETFEFDKSAKMSIRWFIETYRDKSVARVAALNGPENYVLEDDGGWDKPLHDGDAVYFVPCVGYAWPLIALIISMLAYAIYMIANMKFGEGAASTTNFSLSRTENSNPYGKSIEKQYGMLKRIPPYAFKPYTIFENNQQWLYSGYSLGYGYHQFDANQPVGFGSSSAIDFDDVSYWIINPGEAASYFDNNIYTASEVSGGLDLYATNQSQTEEVGWPTSYNGKYFGWFSACPQKTEITEILADFEFPNGHYDNYADGDKISRTTTWQLQYRKATIVNGAFSYGPTTTVNYSYTGWMLNAIRMTKRIPVPSGFYQVRCRRTSQQWASEGRSRTELKWTALRGKLPNTASFPDTTIVMLKARAQAGLTDSAAKRFYTRTTAKTPVYHSDTQAWVNEATRNPAWVICDLMRAVYGANYPESLLDLEYWSSLADQCDTNGITFDYVFDDETDVWTAISLVMRCFRGAPVAPLGLISAVLDEPGEIPTAVFTKESIIDGTFQIQHKLKTYDKNGGARVGYTDEDTDEEATVDAVPNGYDGTNLKSFKAYGIRNRIKAYRYGMYSFLTEQNNGTALKFETNCKGWLCLPNDIVAVNYPLFRKHLSGRILSISDTTVVLDRNVKLQDDYPNVFKICSHLDGSVLGTYAATYADYESGDYHTLTLDSAPTVTGMEFDDPQALPCFMLGIGSNVYEKCRVVSKQDTDAGTAFEVFIDDGSRFAYDDSYPDLSVPNIPPVDAPGTPGSVTIAPYDIEEDGVAKDTLISWTSVGSDLPYIVQTSIDAGATWQTVTSTESGTSVLTGDYVSGTYIARVAAIYKGISWAWGYSESTYLPPNLTQGIISSNNDFVMVSSDGKIMAFYGV